MARGNPRGSAGREELKELVTDDEHEAIRDSRKNAFYTSPEVVNNMWDTLEGMGIDDVGELKILEPSAGSGRFLGLQPKKLKDKSERTAVELDSLTAQMLKQLYPETRVFHSGFESAPLPNDYYDLAISNVPFGDVAVYDREFNTTGRKHLTKAVHNYFFAKALDKVRPGGVLAFITSHYTMDAPSNEHIRKYIAEKADLLGAVRLPAGALPGTEVVADIIYLRKRDPENGPGDDDWVETEMVRTPGERGPNYYSPELPINRYFLDNPGHVLGDHSSAGSMYRGNEYTVKMDPDRPFQRGLADFSDDLSAVKMRRGSRQYSGGPGSTAGGEG